MGYEKILYFFSHGNKSNNAFLFDIVNIPGRISINNTFLKIDHAPTKLFLSNRNGIFFNMQR